MGKFLALSLLCTLTSAALFQPALMGEPRRAAGNVHMRSARPELRQEKSQNMNECCGDREFTGHAGHRGGRFIAIRWPFWPSGPRRE
jgi:hypothetical protein